MVGRAQLPGRTVERAALLVVEAEVVVVVMLVGRLVMVVQAVKADAWSYHGN